MKTGRSFYSISVNNINKNKVSKSLNIIVLPAAAIQAGQWGSRCGDWVGDTQPSGKMAQLDLPHLHPSLHPDLPCRVG